MKNYIWRKLQKIDPCGVKYDGSHRCKHVEECNQLKEECYIIESPGEAPEVYGGFICLSGAGHQVAEYLHKGMNIQQQKKDLRKFLGGSLEKQVVDPREEFWRPKRLIEFMLGQEEEKIVDKIISRGKKFYKIAHASR